MASAGSRLAALLPLLPPFLLKLFFANPVLSIQEFVCWKTNTPFPRDKNQKCPSCGKLHHIGSRGTSQDGESSLAWPPGPHYRGCTQGRSWGEVGGSGLRWPHEAGPPPGASGLTLNLSGKSLQRLGRRSGPSHAPIRRPCPPSAPSQENRHLLSLRRFPRLGENPLGHHTLTEYMAYWEVCCSGDSVQCPLV